MLARKKKAGNNRKRSTLWALCLMTLIWTALPISVKAEAETSPETAYGAESSATAEKVYKLSPPGEDPRMLHLFAGEKAFRSRKLKEAREAFEKALALNSQDAHAHYFLGLIEYAEGNIEKAKARFQIAHECLDLSSEISQLPISDKQAQVEFPDEYEVRMYYKDGWYVNPKDPAVARRGVHPLESGSTYRIELKQKHKGSWFRAGIVGLVVVFSFFLSR